MGETSMTVRPTLSEPVYEVVWPLGKSHWDTRAPNERVADLRGKTICEIWDHVFRGEQIFPIIRATMQKLYPGVRFIEYDKFGDTHGPRQKQVLEALPGLLKQYGCDAVISGVGA
jgi:hypothetical protein